MSANALSAQGATLTIGTTGTAKNITAITKANPAVVTSTAHGLTDGTVVTIAAVTGMTEINGKVAVTRSTGANTFELVGVDSTAFTTYTSGGTATPTAAKVGLWKTWSGLDGQASDIDVTDLDSLAKEYRAGLIDYGSFSGTCQFSLTDAGQMALRSSQAAAGPSSAFVITHKSGAILARFNGYCKQFSQSGGVDQVVDSNFSVKISGAVTYA